MHRFVRNIAIIGIVAGTVVASPVFAETPSTKSVERLVKISGGEAIIDSMFAQLDQMTQAMIAQATAGQPIDAESQAVMDQYIKRANDIVREELSWKTVGPMMVRVYKKNFTQAEIDGLVDFYESDIGKTFVAKMPQVTQDSMQQVMSLMPPVMERLQALSKDFERDMDAANNN